MMVNRVVSVDETYTLPAPIRAALLDLLGAGSPGRPLALTSHNPTTQAEYVHPQGGTSFVALSPANLSVTFVAPATGRVVVDLECHVNDCGGRGYWALLNGSTNVGHAVICGVTGESDAFRGRARLVVGDLTPGQSYTLQWAAAVTTGNFKMRVGGTGGLGSANSGPATMVVWASP